MCMFQHNSDLFFNGKLLLIGLCQPGEELVGGKAKESASRCFFFGAPTGTIQGRQSGSRYLLQYYSFYLNPPALAAGRCGRNHT